MDQKLVAKFEVTKNNRTYSLEVANNAPLGELYDVLHELLVAVLEMSKKAAENAKQAEPAPEVQAEVV